VSQVAPPPPPDPPDYLPTPPPQPAAPAGPPQVPVRETVADAWHLLLSAPAAVMLPSLVIQVPLAIAAGAITALLFLTRFDSEPFVLIGEITGETHRGLVFALVAITAVQVLFSQVARAATVVAVAGVATGQAKPLAQALDPAFTRMGAVFWQTILVLALNVALIVSVFGIVLLPYVMGRLGTTTEVMMLEGQRPMAALTGSWRLLARRVTRFLGVVLLTAVICLGPFVVVSLLGLAVTGTRTQQVVLSAVLGVAQAVITTPALALLSSVITLFYLKAREIDHGRSPARIRPAQPKPPGQGA
jgi:hypothetical protein